jgi:arylsulfatase A-like enzyme
VRLLPVHLLGTAYLAAWAATRLLPRSVSTPSLVVNVLLAAAAAGSLLVMARMSWRCLQPLATASPARPGRTLFLAALPLLAAALALAPGPGPLPRPPVRGDGAAPPNVLVVLVDSFRADRLGVSGSGRGLTPRLDAFAADAAAFTEARTSSPWTKPSVASLLTGLRPERHGMLEAEDVLAPDVETLHTVLGAAGWRTALFSDSHWPVPEFGFQRGVNGETVVPEAGGIRGSLPWAVWAMGRDFALDAYARGTPASIRGAPELGRRFLAWADGEDPRPWCAYIHWMEPHHPYASARPRDPRRRRVPVPVHLGVNPFDRGAPIPAADLADLVANYDDEVRAVDGAFGALLDGLAARGWMDRTAVVFVSDHGEEFFEHDGWTHEHSLCEEVVRIPLLVRVPGGAGRGARIPGQVRIEDVLPTLLDVAGVAAPVSIDGRSLGPLLAGAPVDPRPSTGLCRRRGSGTVVRSAVLDGWKVISGERGPLRTERFFDLAFDPGELHPVDSPRSAASWPRRRPWRPRGPGPAGRGSRPTSCGASRGWATSAAPLRGSRAGIERARGVRPRALVIPFEGATTRPSPWW